MNEGFDFVLACANNNAGQTLFCPALDKHLLICGNNHFCSPHAIEIVRCLKYFCNNVPHQKPLKALVLPSCFDEPVAQLEARQPPKLRNDGAQESCRSGVRNAI